MLKFMIKGGIMNNKNVFELTNPQKNIWNMEEYFKDTTINNICTSVLLDEIINVKLLKQAINNIVKKNDSFRISIYRENGIPKQKILDFIPFDIEVINVNTKKEMSEIEKNEANIKFDILKSNLFRFKIIMFPNNIGGIILTVHHMIADSWSLGLTVKNLIKEYHSLLNNTKIIENDQSYINYIASETQYKNSIKFQNDKQFWENTFKEIPSQVSIPSTKKLQKHISCIAKRSSFSINKNIIKKLNAFCRKEKISPFNFFIAIFSLYLNKFTNLNNFVIGTPILNRANFNEKNTMGMFVNTIPININIDPLLNFCDFAKTLSLNMMSLLRHQKYSYNQILEDIRNRHPNENIPNLYNILISYQITKAFDEDLGNYTSNWIFNNCCGNDLNIHISDINDTGDIIINYDYLTDKYFAKDIEHLHYRILHIINQILNHDIINMKDIEIVTPKEKNKLLYQFNNTEVYYDKNKSIVELFEEQVERTPNNIAIVFQDKKLTYKELNERSNNLANYLKYQGIQNNDICAIIINRSIEMIISILGVLKTGAAYIPIDPHFPTDRIEYILNDSKVKNIITEDSLIHNFNNISYNITNINDKRLSNFPKTNLYVNHFFDDLCYLIYTSGSTGKPKGVMLKKGALSNLINYCNRYISYLNDNKYHTIISVTTISFDIFIFETLIALQKGLKLVIANEDAQTNAVLLNSIIEKENVEIMQTTPSRMKLLLNDYKHIPNIDRIKYLTLAGEQLPISLLHKLQKVEDRIIYNGYGPSETTVFSTLTNVTNNSKVTIGKPLDNTYIYILNNSKNICPIGCIGELYISGDGVGKGYINKDELTQKSFIPDPFRENYTMYKTGDIGYFTNSGDMICLGRIDNQVKIRGLRIELEEIERQMLHISNISNCCVIKRTLDDGREFLCAYYTKEGPVKEKALRTQLRLKLPIYMVPQYFVELNSLPYTPNGKIDRKLLPMPILKSEPQNIIPPRNNVDKKLISILKKQLHLDEISIDDNLFDLGADSLTAISLSTKILEEFNKQIYVKDILSQDTIMSLSNFINSAPIYTEEHKALFKHPHQDLYPLSSAQRRIYYTSQMIGNDNIVYNMPGGILINKILDSNKIKEIFNKIIKRHSVFRTNFIVKDGDIYQKISENTQFKINISESSETEMQNIIKHFSKPFDLEKDCLLRVSLYYLDNAKTLLLIDSHHIIMDGLSLNNLIIEFNRLYNNEFLKEIPVDYSDYSLWENNSIINNEFSKCENYWVNKFKDYEISDLNLPFDYTQPNGNTYRGKKQSYKLSKSKFKQIERYAKSLGISSYALFVSAFFVLLYKYTGQDDITLGSPFANRNLNETKRMVGMFVNNIVLKSHINADISFANFAKDMQNQILDDLSNQPFPFDILIKKLGIKTDGSRNPLFNVMFTYQNNSESTLKIENENVDIIEIDNDISKFDLSLEIKPSNNTINIEYCVDLFKDVTIERLFEHYMNTIESIINNSNILIKDITIISEQEKNRILYEFNNSKLEFAKNKTLIDIFEMTVFNNPDNIAVIFQNSTLTYHELNEQSNLVASNLLNLGIKKGDTVGVCLNRCPDLLICIWAILKIGAIYMPMYVDYPNDRLMYMLENSNSKLLISDSCTINRFKNFNGLKQSISNIKSNIHYEFYINNTISPDDIAYIIYTSGSTGKPKGVQISHKNLINFIYVFTHYFNNNISNTDSLLASTNISFDVSIFELFMPILNGAKLVLYEEEIIKDVIIYCNSLIKNKITFAYIPPNILNEVFNIISTSSKVYLNKLLVGVESIKKSTLNKYLSLNENMKIINGYGPTETTICCTALPYKFDNSNDDIVSIGYPLNNNNIYILDCNSNIQPIGITGELCVTGAGVGHGYINNKPETDKKYLDNFIDQSSPKLYKTGDLAKWNVDGTISFLGRNDSQVKISGHRIELNEINNTILSYPNIKSSYTLLHKIGNSYKIISYFTAEISISEKNLLFFLKSKLADFMVPNFILQLEHFPLTANGKIDKSKLKTDFSFEKSKYVPPRNITEQTIINIWKILFQTEKIGIDDNFFDLGGDSLLAIKFQTEAIKHNLKISYSDIFSFSTPRKLAEKKLKSSNISTDIAYDYSKINSLLAKNIKSNIQITQITQCNIGNVLLLGSTGFLGAHILDNYMANYKGNIYCIVRKKNNTSPTERLKKILHFYFGNKYDNEFDKRIFVIPGDITEENTLSYDSNLTEFISNNIDIVIHSAALVKHYGSFQDFNKINVLGTQNIINFCKKYNKKLYYVSTLSVSGLTLNNSKNNKITYFKESDLFINQNLNNMYIYTKFEAEKLIYNEILNGLSACVLRIGNITNRYSDGVFQFNTSDNAFVNRMQSIINLGVLPENYLEHSLEFTPVDICASAIIKIISSNPSFCTFHLHNINYIKLSELLNILKTLCINITPVSNRDFSNKIDYFLNSDDLKNKIHGIITDLDNDKNLNLINTILPQSDFTETYLKYLNFSWPEINYDYIKKYIDYFKNIKYLE